MPIWLIVCSSKFIISINFFERSSELFASNKNPVLFSFIVSFDPPILLATIGFFIAWASTDILPKASGSIDEETIIDNKTGILFHAGNSDDMSKKIIELLNLDESTLNQMGIEGRKNIINKFNVEKMCFSTYSEYKKLIN